MKITYALASLSRKAGGMFDICRRLAQTVGDANELAVLGLADQFTQQDLAAWRPLRPEVFRITGPASFGFAQGYAGALARSNPEVVHVHGLWMYPSFAAHRWSLKSKRPLIYSAHGMLDPWAIQNSGWKKKLARFFYEDAAHRSAACFHVNSEMEYRSVRSYGLRNPVCIIPNGIDLPDTDKVPHTVTSIPYLDGRKVLLYLGRLHPKKNLKELIKAWALSRRDQETAPEWVLVIAGWDQAGHEAELRRLVSDLSVTSSVFFAGALYGGDKASAYLRAAAFVLPSLSEGLPMVALEAWSFARPVLMTDECNLAEGFTAGAALRIGTNAEEIVAGLRKLFELDESDLANQGARGRALVQEKYSWREIGTEMRRVYEWASRGESLPSSVRIG